jgi:hypothetical protein
VPKSRNQPEALEAICPTGTALTGPPDVGRKTNRVILDRE